MTTQWCGEVVQQAIEEPGKPVIINSDQDSQFTSDVYTGLRKTEGIRSSMDGKGRTLDNLFIEQLWRIVKYEYVYLHV